MLDEYKEIFRQCADTIPGWQELSKNDLCRKYVENEGNVRAQNAYFSAIMYRYWYLISKYYYMSNNVASLEDCYEWLEDSVYGCLKAVSWDREDSSIYKDPNGPDKVINRCMKCARLTFYQFINRKKRKDSFGQLSLEEMIEASGNKVNKNEALNSDSNDSVVSEWAVHEYIIKAFNKKDYFVAFLIDLIKVKDIFDTSVDENEHKIVKLNLSKLVRQFSSLDDKYIKYFSSTYGYSVEEVEHAMSYITSIKQSLIKPKIQSTLERLRHDSFFKMLHGGS